jgi:hypothetical protein
MKAVHNLRLKITSSTVIVSETVHGVHSSNICISLKTSQEIIQTVAKKSLTTYNPPKGFWPTEPNYCIWFAAHEQLWQLIPLPIKLLVTTALFLHQNLCTKKLEWITTHSHLLYQLFLSCNFQEYIQLRRLSQKKEIVTALSKFSGQKVCSHAKSYSKSFVKEDLALYIH